MKSFLRTSTLLFGATILCLAQAGVHAHANSHEERDLSDVLSELEADGVAQAESYVYGSGGSNEYSGGGGDDGYQGNGYEGEGGGYGQTIRETKTLVETAEYGSGGMGYGEQDVQTSIELSIVTMTVVETAPPSTVTYTLSPEMITQTVTYTPMPEKVTEMVTVISTAEPIMVTEMMTITSTPAPQMVTEMVTITSAPEPQMVTQMVTVTEAGTCSTIGLATGSAAAVETSAMSVESPPYISVASITTEIAVASYTAMAPPSVASSGQIAQGSGVSNSAGSCDCQCFCAENSFPPPMSYAAAALPPSAAPTTMQTVAYAAGSQGSAATSQAEMGASYTMSGGNAYPSSPYSAASDVATSSTDSAAATSSSPDTAAAASSNALFTLQYTTASTTSSSSYPSSSAAADTAPTLASPQPAAATAEESSISAAPDTQPTPASVPFDISTLSLSSQLVLGNLAAQATTV